MVTGFCEITRKGVPHLEVHTLPLGIHLLKLEKPMNNIDTTQIMAYWFLIV
jgi:hypothetical protein